ELDDGRGGAEIWTLQPLDREQQREIILDVMVSDAGGLTAKYPVTLVVDDINDNPMKPGTKTVYLWKTQGGGPDAVLGRVFVDDPDDWDIEDKTFQWAGGSQHPLFRLDPNTGIIFASSHIREGRYELSFLVSDHTWGQHGVEANVTVVVRILPQESLQHAVPLTLSPTSPSTLTHGWTPSIGGGGLGALLDTLMMMLGQDAKNLEVVSLYDSRKSITELSRGQISTTPSTPSTTVWIAAKLPQGGFMDPVKLQGLISLDVKKLEHAVGMSVFVQDQNVQGSGQQVTGGAGVEDEEDTAASLPSTSLMLQVVDSNSTSLVTPRLVRSYKCNGRGHDSRTSHTDNMSCTPSSCLNGGRCLRTEEGHKCICPGRTWGSHCKIVSRTFSGNGWAWLRPLPPCLPLVLSLRLLAAHPQGMLLYAGPQSPTGQRHGPAPLLALQLVDGRPQLILDGPRGHLMLTLQQYLHDQQWHTLHVHIDNEGAMLMVDRCGRGWNGRRGEDHAHCVAHASWLEKEKQGTEAALGITPLQLGGIAGTHPNSHQYGWLHSPTSHHFEGCLEHFTINGKVVDLGSPSHSVGTNPGCMIQDTACQVGCGVTGRCVGGLRAPWCRCARGWSSYDCTTPMVAATLANESYVKLALNFRPDPYTTSLQVRVRTRGMPNALLVQLATQHHTASLQLMVVDGRPCVSVTGTIAVGPITRICLDNIMIGDGMWHTVRAERHGHNLLVALDDGENGHLNETWSLLGSHHLDPPAPLLVDPQEGVTVGGQPDHVGVSVIKIKGDLNSSCISDLRVDGRELPLPPAANGTSWGQVSAWEHLQSHCKVPGDHSACANLKCHPPLSCTHTWATTTCGCKPGQQLVLGSCKDVDECLDDPCLHGGTCLNLSPGYRCSCTAIYEGSNCQWVQLPAAPSTLSSPGVVAAITVPTLVIVILILTLVIRYLHLRAVRQRKKDRDDGIGGGEKHKNCEGADMERENNEEDVVIHTITELLKKRERRGESNKDLGPNPLSYSGPLPAKDDLRAYAYEGEGSSSTSLSSALSNLHAELAEYPDGMVALTPEFCQVIDLLRNLPDANTLPRKPSKEKKNVQNEQGSRESLIDFIALKRNFSCKSSKEIDKNIDIENSNKIDNSNSSKKCLSSEDINKIIQLISSRVSNSTGQSDSTSSTTLNTITRSSTNLTMSRGTSSTTPISTISPNTTAN
ncbi:unnamed protein product, partial [Meganyctiphanes norvegica]